MALQYLHHKVARTQTPRIIPGGLQLTPKPVRRGREQDEVPGSEGAPREISRPGRGWGTGLKRNSRASRKATARRGAESRAAVSCQLWLPQQTFVFSWVWKDGSQRLRGRHGQVSVRPLFLVGPLLAEPSEG